MKKTTLNFVLIFVSFICFSQPENKEDNSIILSSEHGSENSEIRDILRFEGIEHFEGEIGAVGSKSKILLEQGKRKMELLETILTNDLPKEKMALYEHVHMTNTQTSRFKKINEERTEYISEVEYTKFNGFMPKMMAKLFPSMFKKQSQKWMDQFKIFAESD